MIYLGLSWGNFHCRCLVRSSWDREIPQRELFQFPGWLAAGILGPSEKAKGLSIQCVNVHLIPIFNRVFSRPQLYHVSPRPETYSCYPLLFHQSGRGTAIQGRREGETCSQDCLLPILLVSATLLYSLPPPTPNSQFSPLPASQVCWVSHNLIHLFPMSQFCCHCLSHSPHPFGYRCLICKNLFRVAVAGFQKETKLFLIHLFIWKSSLWVAGFLTFQL